MTKVRQFVTDRDAHGADDRDDDPSILPAQQTVLRELLRGATVTAAASTGGVAARTVHRWLKSDAVFIAMYNRARRDMAEAQRSRLMELTALALDTVERALNDGDARTALAILKGAGLLSGTAPQIGDDDPEHIAFDRDLEAKREVGRREQAETFALLGM